MSLCWFFALKLRINPTARSTFAFPSHLAQLNPEDSCGAFFHLRQYDPASDLESHFSIRFGAILDDQNDTLALKFVSHIHDSKSLHPSSRPEDFEMKWEEPMKLMDLTRSYPRFRCDPSLYEFESCGGFLPTFAAEAWNCVSWVQLELHISWVAECIILSLENIWTYDENMIFKVNHSASFLNHSLFACFRRSSTNGRHIPSFVDRWSRNLTQSFSGADRRIVGSWDRRPKFPKEYGRIMKDLSNFQGVRSPSKVLPDKCLLPLFLIRNDPNHVAWQILTTSLNLWGLAW